MSAPMTWMVRGKGVEHITPASRCYELPSLPPPDDFVVFVDEKGKVIRWEDPRWAIGTALLNFGYEPSPNQTLELTPDNGELLKCCVAWLIWGERRGIACSTLQSYFQRLKPIFAACSGLAVPIAASDMGRFFDTIKGELAAAINPSQRSLAIGLLDEMWEARERLGFELLTPEQLARLRHLVPDHEGQQHHFIPPRIWAYQAERMRAFLKDFLDHKAQFEALLQELASAYRTNFGSLAEVPQISTVARNPCQQTKKVAGCVYLGLFADVARRHGVAEVIERWLFGPGTSWGSLPPQAASTRLLGQYFNSIGFVGTAYLQCLSGMRIGEASSLRSDCLSIEHDPVLGDLYILSGETTKTTQDPDARWMTAPSAALAVEAMSTIARWRTNIAIELGSITLTAADRANPCLVVRAYEPWLSGDKSIEPAKRTRTYEISKWRSRVAGLFDDEALRITAADELYLRRFSANADLERYGEGCVWHFQSHQYRRTVQVMMAASGVSLPARQQQLKHLTSAQSAYYADGFENLRLNRSFGHELVSTRYELVSVEAGLLNGPDYVSPHGEGRKSELLHFFSVSSRDEITKALSKGQLTVKQTLLGICTKPYCEYGGLDNYVHCPTCVDALMDRRKRTQMEREGRTIAVRLIDAPAGTPLRAVLDAKAKAIGKYMNVTA